MANKATVSKSKSAKKPSPKGRKSTPSSSNSKAKTKKTTKTATAKTRKAGEEEVTIDRRRKADRREEEATEKSSPNIERREKVQRRRQIDPTTCERDYSVQEVDFMNAMDEYKRKSGRMFPTCSEVLEVIRGLGYVQLTPAELMARGSDADQEGSVEADPNFDTGGELETVEASEFGEF